MYLSLLRLNPASAAVQRDLRDLMGLHRTIMKAYPDIYDPQSEPRAYFGVLHRLEFDRRTGRILLYVQSKTEPTWAQLPDGYLYPEDGMPNPAVKPIGALYSELKAGRILRFRLRANPTRKVDTKSGPDGARRNGRRIPLRGMPEQIGWLARKADDHGFELVQAAVAASGSTELVRSHDSGRTFQGVLYEGRLAVRDPERFQAAVAAGIGPGKAFGFGLLSVGPD